MALPESNMDIRVAFITRSTIHQVPGGDTEQILQTAKCLRKLGVQVEIFLTSESIDYSRFDLFHFFNITRPADILYHLGKTSRPVLVSTILVDYSEFDKYHRKGLTGLILHLFPARANEYVKTIARWLLGKDTLRSKSFLWKGQRRSIIEILHRSLMLLPNSVSEYQEIEALFGVRKNHAVIYNGINTDEFPALHRPVKDHRLVLSAARIEGRKNQLNLIRALNNTRYTLLLTGLPAPNQVKYYEECKRIAASNIVFCGRVPLSTLHSYYQKAKVHVLPSWHETCGLSSLEAAAMGCNIVITDKGFTREYFGEDAFYCEPGDPRSILDAVEQAAAGDYPGRLQQKVFDCYTWQRAAADTFNAYQTALSVCKN